MLCMLRKSKIDFADSNDAVELSAVSWLHTSNWIEIIYQIFLSIHIIAAGPQTTRPFRHEVCSDLSVGSVIDMRQ